MMRRALIPLAVVLAALVAAPLAGAAQSPQQLLASIIAAGQSQQSVHYVANQASPTIQVKMVADAGRTAGIQRIAFTQGKKTGNVTIVVAGNTAYVRGDAFALANYMHFPAAVATQYANHWIRIPHTHHLYAEVAAAVTLESAIEQLVVKPPLVTLHPTPVAGKPLVGVGGTVDAPTGIPAAGAVYAAAATPHLPVRSASRIGSLLLTIDLSRWNEQVGVTAPTKSVPVTAIHTGPSA